jgi:hypothetical protein
MTISTGTASHPEGIKKKVEDEARKAFALTVYFGIWFCALTFLGATALHNHPLSLSIYGIAIIKAGLCAKFMLIAQAMFPIRVSKTHGIIKSLFFESILYIFVVLGLNYIEAGVEGLIHGKNFLDSMSSFGEKNPLHILAMSIVYWLIVWPYLILAGMKLALGANVTLAILFGRKDSSGH